MDIRENNVADRADHVVQEDDGLQCLALGEEILKLFGCPVGLGQEMLLDEPPAEQTLARLGRPVVAAVTPGLHFLAERRDERRQQLLEARRPQRFIRRKPADGRIEDRVRVIGKVGMQGHYFVPLGLLAWDSTCRSAHRRTASAMRIARRYSRFVTGSARPG